MNVPHKTDWRNVAAIVALAAATILSGTGYLVVTGIAAADLAPLTIATGQRIVGAVLVLLFLALPRGRTRPRSRSAPTRRQRRWLVVLSLTNVPLLGCLVWGFSYSTAANAALIERLDLPMALVVGRAVLGEPARRLDGLIILPLIAGVLMVLEVWPGHLEARLLGDLLFVSATVLLVANAVLIRRHLAGVSPLTITKWNLGCSAVWFVVLHVGVYGYDGLIAAGTTPRSALLLAVLGVCAVVEMTAYYGLLQRLSIWYVRCLLLLIPLLTVVVEHHRREVSFSAVQYAGTALILLCLLMLIAHHMVARGAAEPPAPGEEGAV